MTIYDPGDNHTLVTIPPRLLRDVFGNEHALALLLHIAEARKPVRYTVARQALGMHPQQFQRALHRLEEFALVGLRAPADLNRPEAKRTYYVYLELTALGSFHAALWHQMARGYTTLAKKRGIPEELLQAATAE
jgi:DNA-binding IclR family transcriptional regulator